MHLARFPLHTVAEENALAKAEQRRQSHLSQVRDTNALKEQHKIGHLVLRASGADCIMGPMKLENALHKLNAKSAEMVSSDNSVAILTRWASDELQPTLIVDVLEHRGKVKWQGSAIYLKVNGEATIEICNKWVTKKLKPSATYSKTLKSDPCDSISLVLQDKRKVRLEVVYREERPIAPITTASVMKRFKKEWIVPVAC
jgi:hypothetical protein